MLFKFDSGYAIGEHALGTLVPVFSAGWSTNLVVSAGAENTDSNKASIYLEKVTSITTRWYHYSPGTEVPMQEPPNLPSKAVAMAQGGRGIIDPVETEEVEDDFEDAAPRRRRGAPRRVAKKAVTATKSAPSTLVHTGMLVGKKSIVVSRSSIEFVQSPTYLKYLAEYEDPKNPDGDYQALAHKYCGMIHKMHGLIRSRMNDPLPTTDDTVVDPEGRLRRATQMLREMLVNTRATPEEDMVDADGEVLLVEGTIQLREVLAHYGISVDESTLEELQHIPVVQLNYSVEDYPANDDTSSSFGTGDENVSQDQEPYGEGHVLDEFEATA